MMLFRFFDNSNASSINPVNSDQGTIWRGVVIRGES